MLGSSRRVVPAVLALACTALAGCGEEATSPVGSRVSPAMPYGVRVSRNGKSPAARFGRQMLVLSPTPSRIGTWTKRQV